MRAGGVAGTGAVVVGHGGGTEARVSTGVSGRGGSFFTSLCWLLYIPVAGSNIVGWFALSGYCSLYPALWAAFCWWLFPGKAESAEAEVAAMAWRQRIGWGASCAVAWVAMECLRAG